MRKTKQEVHGGGEENVKELGVRVEDVEERARKTKNTSDRFIKARLSDNKPLSGHHITPQGLWCSPYTEQVKSDSWEKNFLHHLCPCWSFFNHLNFLCKVLRF